jgi:hypothetical protein
LALTHDGHGGGFQVEVGQVQRHQLTAAKAEVMK